MGKAMRFLIDEDVPMALFKFLKSEGFDVRRVIPSTTDRIIALEAKEEGRILVTLDKDFSNPFLFPPSELTIVWVRLHPPDKNVLLELFKKFLSAKEPIKGLIILQPSGPLRVVM